MQWIESDGGPLICIERESMSLWGGIDALTVPSEGVKNDYERTGDCLNYIETIALSEGSALILGGEPLRTTIWRIASGRILIARPVYADAKVDLEEMLRGFETLGFSDPIETVEIEWKSPVIDIFDSAWPGAYRDKDLLSIDVEPGTYRVLTQELKPDEENFFIMHAMDLVGQPQNRGP